VRDDAVDGILHLLGDHRGCMGAGPEYLSKERGETARA